MDGEGEVDGEGDGEGAGALRPATAPRWSRLRVPAATSGGPRPPGLCAPGTAPRSCVPGVALDAEAGTACRPVRDRRPVAGAMRRPSWPR